MATSFAKTFSDEILKYLSLQFGYETQKQILQGIDKEKLKDGIIAYLNAYFKVHADSKIRDAGIESGTCYPLNLDISEILDSNIDLSNLKVNQNGDKAFKIKGGRFSVIIKPDQNIQISKSYDQSKPFKVERHT